MLSSSGGALLVFINNNTTQNKIAAAHNYRCENLSIASVNSPILI
jgi:hypothetical protein